MLNQVILLGRLAKDPEITVTPNGKKVSTITLAVTKPFKNKETGNYDVDYLACTLWEGLAERTHEFCKKGKQVGIKGRLQANKFYYDEEKYFQYPEIVVEKITFI